MLKLARNVRQCGRGVGCIEQWNWFRSRGIFTRSHEDSDRGKICLQFVVFGPCDTRVAGAAKSSRRVCAPTTQLSLRNLCTPNILFVFSIFLIKEFILQ